MARVALSCGEPIVRNTLLRWLELREDDLIELEWGEDVVVVRLHFERELEASVAGDEVQVCLAHLSMVWGFNLELSEDFTSVPLARGWGSFRARGGFFVERFC